MKKISGFILFGLLWTAAAAQDGAGQEFRYFDQSKTWEQRFTYKGQPNPGPYGVDPNVWVYTEEFSQRFGMPQQWVDQKLRGIEAAAWRRVPQGYQTCGWAGKEAACKQEYRCYLDVYIDERKNTLPWESEQKVDWHEDFTSLRWLPSQKGERHRPLSAFVGQHMRYGGVTRSPFVDSENQREAFYFAFVHPKSTGALERMFGYERSAYEGLTLLVMLPLLCEFGADSPPTEHIYRLETRSNPTIAATVLKRFHEFVLPADFDRRAKAIVLEQRRAEREFNKQALDLK
jgi:hypothetical protein